MYSMAALEKALAVNPTPLLHFAATKEFTGENVVFLLQVRDWRAAWDRAIREFGTGQVRYRLFNIGVEIFTTSVHTKTADFPINVAGKVRSKLEVVFGPAVVGVKYLDENIVDPFNHPSFGIIGHELRNHTASESAENFLSLAKLDLDVIHEVPETAADIPAGFDEHIFDEAEASVKHMVITNTWPKFVDSCQEHDDVIEDKMT
jgi:hypothetical protein